MIRQAARLGRAVALAGTGLLGAAPAAAGAPTVTGVFGTIEHGGIVTIAGTDFGHKLPAQPSAWDDASGGDLLDVWDGYWPDASDNPDFDLAYRTPIRGIDLPHDNVSRYIAGAHGESGGFNRGFNVMLFKNRQIESYPAYTFASWYQRADDAWSFCGDEGLDDNFKVYDYSKGTSPYTFPENWYLEYNPRPTSTSNVPGWHLNDDGDALTKSVNWFQESALNPMAGEWVKIQLEIKWTSLNNGYVRLWENGVPRVDYVGATDRYPGNRRSEGIGGYARCQGYDTNWRYFADVYLDHSRARVVLADAPDYDAARIIEPQIPLQSAWNDGSISATVNLGSFEPDEDAYVFVFDPSGRRNALGHRVTVGDDTAQGPAPASPTGVRAAAE